jgi:hypothetical protein
VAWQHSFDDIAVDGASERECNRALSHEPIPSCNHEQGLGLDGRHILDQVELKSPGLLEQRFDGADSLLGSVEQGFDRWAVPKT